SGPLYSLMLLNGTEWMAVPPVKIIDAENSLRLFDKCKIDPLLTHTVKDINKQVRGEYNPHL
ncbi:unnamed protein product, partial [marine sediment metagenome]